MDTGPKMLNTGAALLTFSQVIFYLHVSFHHASFYQMINGLHLYHAVLTSCHSKLFTVLPNIHPFITHSSWSGAVRVGRLAQGHLHTLGGIQLVTLWLPAHPLYLRSLTPPC